MAMNKTINKFKLNITVNPSEITLESDLLEEPIKIKMEEMSKGVRNTLMIEKC